MVGRKEEIETLQRLYKRNSAEFVAIYGRRRVGKTFLVDEVLGDKINFRHTALSPVEHQAEGFLKAQLENFYHSLKLQDMEESHVPKDWLEAFFMLEKWLQEMDDGGRQVVFLDELPWLDRRGSGFITALEAFWNSWGCHRKNLMLVVCGSASSWILDNLINNHGGLYGRVTCEIKVEPFTLQECEEFFYEEGITLSRYDILQTHMVFDGVPYYLRYYKRGLSVAQMVDRAFFSKKAALREEYDRLFSSSFTNPDQTKKIVEILYERRGGFTRKEIQEKLGISSSGNLTKSLKALIEGDFVEKYVPYGGNRKVTYYKIVDPFCLFYLHFVKGVNKADTHYWQERMDSPEVTSWRGGAFENICFSHIDQIKRALGIAGVRTTALAWQKRGDQTEPGGQIDLLIERADNVVNSCEIQHYSGLFSVDKAYYLKLKEREEILRKELSPRQSIRNTLITTFGLKEGGYSSVFTNVITLDALFEKS